MSINKDEEEIQYNIPSENNKADKKNERRTMAVFITVVIEIILMAVIILTPDMMGMPGVIKKTAGAVVFAVAGVFILLLCIKDNKMKISVRAICVFLGILCILYGAIYVSKGVRAFSGGVQTITVTEYELHVEYKKGADTYMVRTKINGKTEQIILNKNTFNRIWEELNESNNENNSITISYYPYIDIAEEIILNEGA